MDTLIIDELRVLAQQTQDPSISIFMPTHRAGRETQQDPIRLRNLLREAETQLQQREMRTPDIAALLQPAYDLLENSEFWQHQLDGLVLYLAVGDFHLYQLPFTVDDMVLVGQSYYFKPVLPLFTNNGHYYILAISQNDVRLFEGTRHTVGQIDLPQDTPSSLEEALRFDDPEKQLQFHSGNVQANAQSGIFHGHGVQGDEVQKERIERYLNQVDAGLKKLYSHMRAPWVLAGVDYLLPIYRSVSEYAHIMPDGITGNPESLRAQELQEQAWPLVEPYFRQELEAVIGQYHALADSGKATDNVQDVVAAAHFGRVDKIIVAYDAQVWGEFDRENGKAALHGEEQKSQSDIALGDFAAMQTLLNGGAIYALTQAEMPTDSPLAAVFRY